MTIEVVIAVRLGLVSEEETEGVKTEGRSVRKELVGIESSISFCLLLATSADFSCVTTYRAHVFV